MNSLHTVVFYTYINSLTWEDVELMTKNYCASEITKVFSLKIIKDRIATVIGRALLYYMLKTLNIQSSIKNTRIELTDEGRPYIKNTKYDFNISHSLDAVACGIIHNGKIGIDIEAIHDINIEEYRSILTDAEYSILNKHKKQNDEFIKLWTTKESVLKADGRGFYADIKKLSILNQAALLENKMWYNNLYNIDEHYYLSVSTNEIVEPFISEIDVFKLLDNS